MSTMYIIEPKDRQLRVKIIVDAYNTSCIIPSFTYIVDIVEPWIVVFVGCEILGILY